MQYTPALAVSIQQTNQMFYAIKKWGWREVFRQIRVHSWFRGGELVGVDGAGNRYYEVKDPKYFINGKHRYVEYNLKDDNFFYRPDASRVPPHWHGWLHYTHKDPPKPGEEYIYPWVRGLYTENMTGSSGAYVPKSTVPPKIDAYKPVGKIASKE